jgi:uncharacterized membrane protein YccC
MEKELEQIKRIQSINDVITKNSSENTLLYTSSRENESLSDDVIDNMLNRMSGQESERNIHIVESLTRQSGGNEIVKHRHTSVRVTRPRRATVRKRVHILKRTSVKRRSARPKPRQKSRLRPKSRLKPRPSSHRQPHKHAKSRKHARRR